MSLTNEYKELDKIRLEAGEKSRAHYASLNLPGDREQKVDTEAVRARIKKMKEEREKPNHE
jgi:hypothetical protein